MKAKVLVFAFVMLLFVPLSVGATSAVTLTASWQIITADIGGNLTSTFNASQTMNITVYPPETLTIGGIRSLVVWSTEQANELTRYTLGYYASGKNQSADPHSVAVNLGAFPRLIHGDTLLIQIRGVGDVIESTTAVSIQQDVDALLNELKKTMFGMIGNLQNDLDFLRVTTNYALDLQNRYLIGMVIAFVILVAYVTRDKWFSRKKIAEQTKSNSEFEAFLEAFILERYSPGDKIGP